MWLNIMRFTSVLFTALALAPSFAHLLEIANKINLSRDEYLTVQQIYRGWSLLGIVVIAALISTLILTIMVYREKAFALTLTALICIITTQVIFWLFTFPANHVTDNWTQLPANWEKLRSQWEYSHATGAVLNLIAFIALILSLLPPTNNMRTK